MENEGLDEFRGVEDFGICPRSERGCPGAEKTDNYQRYCVHNKSTECPYAIVNEFETILGDGTDDRICLN